MPAIVRIGPSEKGGNKLTNFTGKKCTCPNKTGAVHILSASEKSEHGPRNDAKWIELFNVVPWFLSRTSPHDSLQQPRLVRGPPCEPRWRLHQHTQEHVHDGQGSERNEEQHQDGHDPTLLPVPEILSWLTVGILSSTPFRIFWPGNAAQKARMLFNNISKEPPSA